MWDLTDSDEVEWLSEADTDESQLCTIVITVPDQQFSVGSNPLYSPVVDITSRLERRQVLTFHAFGTVDVAQPVWSARISSVHPVAGTTALVDL